jgi:hypothetical protein
MSSYARKYDAVVATGAKAYADHIAQFGYVGPHDEALAAALHAMLYALGAAIIHITTSSTEKCTCSCHKSGGTCLECCEGP